jgi:hypothetical protein
VAVSLVRTNCANCGCLFAMPQELYEAARRSHLIIFSCPYGHQLHFSEVEKVPTKDKKKQIEKKDNVIDLSQYRKKENE